TCAGPLGQLVGPPCGRLIPAFNRKVADLTIFVARVLEWAGKDRHFVDGSATGTGVFTAIAGSHARFGTLWGHKGRITPFWSIPQVVSFIALFKATHHRR